MLKAFKYRIYPNKEQTEVLNMNFGCVRYVWNKLVENFNNWEKDKPQKTVNEKTLKDNPETPWLKDAISYALQQKRMDFDETKSQFFNKKRKTRIGRMKFKKKGVSRDSFRIPGAQLSKMNHSMCETGKIQLPKMSPMRVVIDRKFNGAIKSFTVSKNKSEQYFVSVLVECDIERKQNTGHCVGIDLGLIDVVTMSDGTKIKAPKFFRKNQAKLATQQRHLSRKTKGSNRYNKQRLKVARLYQKISNQRSWFNHNVSSYLVSNYDIIVLEDLNIAGMKRTFGKSVSDASLGELVRQIEYKSAWYGKICHKIDRWYASSKICSSCGYKLEKGTLKLSDREWVCPECGCIHDRDLNAATNILNKGLEDLYGLTSVELPDYRRGEVNQTHRFDDVTSISREASSNFVDFYRKA